MVELRASARRCAPLLGFARLCSALLGSARLCSAGTSGCFLIQSYFRCLRGRRYWLHTSRSTAFHESCAPLLGFARLCSALLGFARLCSALLGWNFRVLSDTVVLSLSTGEAVLATYEPKYRIPRELRASARLCSALLGSARLCSALLGSARLELPGAF